MNNVSTVKQAAPKKIRKSASLDRRKARAGWIFVLPFIIGMAIIYLPVIYDSVKYSFNEIKILQGGGYQLNWVGLENYQEALFVDPSYVRTLTSGVQQLIFDIPAIVIFALFVAVLLNDKMVGRAAFRAIFFVPVILATGLISDIDLGNTLLSYMGDTSRGIDTGEEVNTTTQIVSLADIGWLFRNMAVGTELVAYVTGAVNNIFDIINRSGVQMLIFLAGLQSISPAIYESCSIDGASAWETFWKITIPMISPMILVCTIYTVIDSFTASSNSVMRYISAIYNEPGGNVLSSAMSWMYFLIVVLIIAVVSAVLSAYVFYQRRD
jgi:ABC-type sugar transport system permease subunit